MYISSKNPVPVIAVGQTSVNSSATFPKTGLESSDISSARHITPVKDSATGYQVPSGIEFRWSGSRRDSDGALSATVTVDHLGATVGEGGLIEKVDVLAEIPYVIRKGLAAVTGTKPYIYQVIDPKFRCDQSLTESTTTRPRYRWSLMARRYLSRDGFSTRLLSSQNNTALGHQTQCSVRVSIVSVSIILLYALMCTLVQA